MMDPDKKDFSKLTFFLNCYKDKLNRKLDTDLDPDPNAAPPDDYVDIDYTQYHNIKTDWGLQSQQEGDG